jgi:hypothetical protein
MVHPHENDPERVIKWRGMLAATIPEYQPERTNWPWIGIKCGQCGYSHAYNPEQESGLFVCRRCRTAGPEVDWKKIRAENTAPWEDD